VSCASNIIIRSTNLRVSSSRNRIMTDEATKLSSPDVLHTSSIHRPVFVRRGMVLHGLRRVGARRPVQILWVDLRRSGAPSTISSVIHVFLSDFHRYLNRSLRIAPYFACMYVVWSR
jgi:hypothetical protein